MRTVPDDSRPPTMTPMYITAGLMMGAAVTLATGLASSDRPLVTISIVGTVLAGVALAWTCLLNTSEGSDRIPDTSPACSGGTGGRPVNDFPIEDYDDLRADEILPLLQELDPSGLKMVQLREELGAGRRAVLAQLNELLALHDAGESDPRFPIDGYDDMRVVEILPLLKGLTDVDLDMIACHEESTAGRRTILARIARLQERLERLGDTNHRGPINP
jgi:hypothetical protein